VGILKPVTEVSKMKNMKTKVTIGLVIFITTFLVLAMVTPATGDLEVIYVVDDIYNEHIGPQFIEEATVGGIVELLEKDHTVVDAVDYRDVGGTIIEVLPESFMHLGKEVYWLRVSVAWFLPSTNVEWNFLDIECNLYHGNFETGFIGGMVRNDQYWGTLTFEDIFLDDYFDSDIAGYQTQFFKAVMLMHGEVVVDGEVADFDRRFVEDVPVTVRVELPAGYTDTLYLEDPNLWQELIDEKQMVTTDESISESTVYEVDIPGIDEPIFAELDFYDSSHDAMSFFGGADSPLSTVQQLMLLAGIITVVIIIFSDGKGRKMLEDLGRQLGRMVPKQLRW
jgi:hypothetical protein